MNFLSDRFSGSEADNEFRCRCGAQPKLIRRIMDPRNGVTVRIFECPCGQRSWSEDKR